MSGLDSAHRPHLVVDGGAGTESVTVAIPGRGVKRVTINTTKIQEKAMAARAVYEHAVALGASFGPYSQACLDVFLPLVAFKYSSEIRATSAQTLAAVFDSACAYGEEYGMAIPNEYLPRVVVAVAKQIQDEDTVDVDAVDMDTVYAMADSLCDLCRTMFLYGQDHGAAFVGSLSPGDVKNVVQIGMASMVACLKRRSHLTGILAEGLISGEDERNELEDLLLKEEDLLTPLVDSVGYFVKSFGPAIVPAFAELVAPALGPNLGGGHDPRARLSAVCLFDDCVEHCGSAAAVQFGPRLMVGILSGLESADAELTRASLYGVAQLARHAPASVLAPHAAVLAPRLLALISGPNQGGRDGDDDDGSAVMYYETAVSALASLVLFDNAPFRNHGLVERETVEQAFLASLPLRDDVDEAKICHAGFCDWIEHGSNAIDVGDSRGRDDSRGANLARVVRATLALVDDGADVASADTCDRLRAILARLLLPPRHATPGAGPPCDQNARPVNGAGGGGGGGGGAASLVTP